MSEETEDHIAADEPVYFVLATRDDDGRWQLATPAAENSLPYVARQIRALALGRLRAEPWQLYELRRRGSNWCVVELTDDGLYELALHPLTLEQTTEIDQAIVCQGRWSGPWRDGELLPQAWEGKLRIRHGKPTFVKNPPPRPAASRETQLASTAAE